MATVDELRDRSGTLFTELLKAQAAAEPPENQFSWFDRDDAVAAATLSFRLSALAASGEERRGGPQRRARPSGQGAARRCGPRRCRSASRCSSPTISAGGGSASRGQSQRHRSSSPRRARPRAAPAISIGGSSPGLDYWREDVLANEHHQHWHEVYPFTGPAAAELRDVARRAPSRTSSWRSSSRCCPGPGLARQSSRTPRPAAARRALRRRSLRRGVAGLPARALPQALHASTTARASCSSTCTSRCSPATTPSCSRTSLDAGRAVRPERVGRPDPRRATTRSRLRRLRPARRGARSAARRRHRTSLQRCRRDRRGADATKHTARRSTARPCRSTGRTSARPSRPPCRSCAALDRGAYPGCTAPATCSSPGLATGPRRDEHPGDGDPRPGLLAVAQDIDDLSARWQDTLRPVALRRRAARARAQRARPARTTPWASPDIILCRDLDLPDGADPASLGEQLFGGDNWDTDFSPATARRRARRSLHRRRADDDAWRTGNFGGRPIQLPHPRAVLVLPPRREPTTSAGRRHRPDLPRPGDRGRRPAGVDRDGQVPGRPAGGGEVVAYRPDTRVVGDQATGRDEPCATSRRRTGRRRATRTATAAGRTRCCCRAARRTRACRTGCW